MSWGHSFSYCQLKKKMHKLRGVSSVLFGAQMRHAAQETAFQMALRSCSKEAGDPWGGEGRSGHM